MYTTTLVERLKLMEHFGRIVPSTMTGKAIFEKYTNIFKGTTTPITDFHNFMCECMQSGDMVLENFAKFHSTHITKFNPTGWKLNMLLEQMSKQKTGINESILDDLKYLTTYNENDLCESIAQGSLSKCLQIPGIRAIHESIVGGLNAKHLNEANVMYTPISAVAIKNGKKYFSLAGKIYEDGQAGISISSEVPSPEFAAANSAAQTIPYNPEVDEFELTFLPGAVNVTSSGKVTKDKESWDVQDVEEMVQQELEDDKLSQQQKIEESRKFDLFKQLIENFSCLCKLDNITAVKNLQTGKSTYLVEHATGHYVIDEAGIRQGNMVLGDAIAMFESLSGAHIKSNFVKRLNEEQQNVQDVQKSKQQLKQEQQKYQDIINQCNEEQQYCEPNSHKYQEFEEIKQQAQQGLDVIKQTEQEL